MEIVSKLPTFPTVDLSETVNWFVDGFTGLVTSNAGLVIGAGLAIFAVPYALRKIKSFGKSAMRG